MNKQVLVLDIAKFLHPGTQTPPTLSPILPDTVALKVRVIRVRYAATVEGPPGKVIPTVGTAFEKATLIDAALAIAYVASAALVAVTTQVAAVVTVSESLVIAQFEVIVEKVTAPVPEPPVVTSFVAVP